MLWRLAALLILAAAPLRAEEVVLGLSSDKVAITATFDGSEILIFGAVKREAPIPETTLDVVITVSGAVIAGAGAPQGPAVRHLDQYRHGRSRCRAQFSTPWPPPAR